MADALINVGRTFLDKRCNMPKPQFDLMGIHLQYGGFEVATKGGDHIIRAKKVAAAATGVTAAYGRLRSLLSNVVRLLQPWEVDRIALVVESVACASSR